MRKLHFITALLVFFSLSTLHSQNPQQAKKVTVTGKIVEAATNQPLEYTTVSLFNTKANKITAGGMTNEKGEFSFEAAPGNYNVKVEFISFKPLEISDKTITDNTNLGTIKLQSDATQLQEVEIRSEKTTVEIKLDKKVYNVGKDLMVKGGTVSDVLDNIPSVAVDVEGNVSLRGNENVKILIDGKPSTASNINDALRQIPADAIDKVEVITNPSARYDAEGGGGLLNIVLKKGKTNGLNGTFIATTGVPDNHGLSGTLNYKDTEFNLFTTQGYNYRRNPGHSAVNTTYFNDDFTVSRYIDEDRETDRLNKGYNGSFGAEWFLHKQVTWVNTINYRRFSNDNEEDVNSNNYDAFHNFDFYRNRNSLEKTKNENVEYASDLYFNFKKEGHKLTLSTSFSLNFDDNNGIITQNSTNSAITKYDVTKNIQDQNRNLFQADYVLPFGKNAQFEAGYRGSFLKFNLDYGVINDGVVNNAFTSKWNYMEKINSFYTQIGFKVSKLSMLYGLRYEDSDIDINQYTADIYKNKKYNNFFPSAFLTYELNEKTNLSLNYSKRINRPRGRELNPFSNYSSNINIFRGNPDLDASLADAFDLGFLKRWEKLTLSTSLYYNVTKNSTQFVRFIEGVNEDGIPISVTSFVNVANEYRTGFEFTLNYTPYKWWRLNSNFNFFRNEVKGTFTYSYVDADDLTQTGFQDLSRAANTWSSRLTSKVTLPYKIEWQTNATYNGPSYNAQSKSKGIFAMNLGFSKDVLKDKATLGLNVNDVFNSRIRKVTTDIPGDLHSDAEMQWRKRQITLSFTYRFNKKKNEQERPKKNQQQEDGGDFQG